MGLPVRYPVLWWAECQKTLLRSTKPRKQVPNRGNLAAILPQFGTVSKASFRVRVSVNIFLLFIFNGIFDF
jgi:hypothetical protein